MSKVSLVISYNGKWNANNRYVDCRSSEFVVDCNISYLNLLDIVYDSIQLHTSSEVKLMVSVDVGCPTFSVLEVKNDKDVCWYLNSLKNCTPINRPLIVSVSSTCSSILPDVFDHGEGCSYSKMEIVPHLGSSSGETTIFGEDNEFQKLLSIEHVNVGDVFSSKSDLHKALHLLAIRGSFEFKTVRSNGDRFTLKCKNDGCQWFFRSSKYSKSDIWVIRDFVKQHTCAMDVVQGDHKNATSYIISECVRENFVESGEDCPVPRNIMKYMRSKHGVSVSYFKAWKAKQLFLENIHGSPEDSYLQLPSLCYALMTTNPGTVTAYTDDGLGHFKYFFFSLAASIQGWPHCRPVISVDGTFLKNKYLGTLLIACCLDANNQIFPLAFAIVDSENNDSWEWFFHNLKSAIGYREDMVFVSDRKSSIPLAISKVFPDADHGFCIRHMTANLKSHFKHPAVAMLFDRCARAYKLSVFEREMTRLEQVAPGIREYLREESYDKWARSHFRRRRYNIMTTNISESINAILKEDRELPIVPLIENIRNVLQKWHYERKVEADGISSVLTPWVEKQLNQQIELGRHMVVQPNDKNEFTVVQGNYNFIVFMAQRSCSCRVWDFDILPCAHACAVISKLRLSAHYFLSPYYFTTAYASTYSAPIHSLGNPSEWLISNEVRKDELYPPKTRRPTGRPKKNCIPSVGEFKRKVRCGKCRQYGHNKLTCKNNIIYDGHTSE